MTNPLSPSDLESKIAQLLPELTHLVVTAVNLDIPVADVSPDAPLYGDGLGLDSIDILEIALVISKKYAVHLKADDENNARIFVSMRTLARYVVEQQALR